MNEKKCVAGVRVRPQCERVSYTRCLGNASGIRQVDIYVSNEAAPGDPEGAGAANWTLWAADAIFTVGAGNASYTGFDLATVVTTEAFALNSVSTRFVRFEVDSTFIGDEINVGGGTLGGQNASLTQIEFFEGAPIPEPGSLALLGLGGLLVASRRRRD